MVENIGRVLRNQRIKQGMSMSDLARSINVSRSFISQMEGGQTFPSLETLEHIAKALNISLSGLFQNAENADVLEEVFTEREIIVRKNERRISQLPEAKNRFEDLTPAEGSYMEFFISTLNPYKSGEPKYEFCHEGEEYVYVIKGPVEFHLGSQAFTMESGDSCCFDGTIKHYYVNYGTEVAQMVCAIPPTFAYTNHLRLGKRVQERVNRNGHEL